METFSWVNCELWELVHRRATPRLRGRLSGFVAWEMRYKNESFNIIFIDTHSIYTLLSSYNLVLQGASSGSDLENRPSFSKNQLILRPWSCWCTLYFLYRNRALCPDSWDNPTERRGHSKWAGKIFLSPFLCCLVIFQPDYPVRLSGKIIQFENFYQFGWQICLAGVSGVSRQGIQRRFLALTLCSLLVPFLS